MNETGAIAGTDEGAVGPHQPRVLASEVRGSEIDNEQAGRDGPVPARPPSRPCP